MLGKRVAEESGAVVVLFALVLVVLFGAVAFAIDLSRLFHERQVLQNAVDFGALAGAQELPGTRGDRRRRSPRPKRAR